MKKNKPEDKIKEQASYIDKLHTEIRRYQKEIKDLEKDNKYLENHFASFLMERRELLNKIEVIYKACNYERVFEIQNRLGELLKKRGE